MHGNFKVSVDLYRRLFVKHAYAYFVLAFVVVVVG